MAYAAVVLFALLVGYVLISYAIYRRAFVPAKPAFLDDFTFTPFEFGIPYDAVAVPGADGVKLPGWWLYRGESSRVVIICIGYRGRRADMLGVAAALWRDGNNVLMSSACSQPRSVSFPIRMNSDAVTGYRCSNPWLSALQGLPSGARLLYSRCLTYCEKIVPTPST